MTCVVAQICDSVGTVKVTSVVTIDEIKSTSLQWCDILDVQVSSGWFFWKEKKWARNLGTYIWTTETEFIKNNSSDSVLVLDLDDEGSRTVSGSEDEKRLVVARMKNDCWRCGEDKSCWGLQRSQMKKKMFVLLNLNVGLILGLSLVEYVYFIHNISPLIQ